MFRIPRQATVSRPDYLAELFQHCSDDYAASREDPVAVPTPSVFAARADSVIRTRFHLPLTAGIAAEHTGCNPRHLSRVYREAYGCTLTEAIQRTRIDSACRLLLDSDLRVSEIARACGMDDANDFHQIFKRLKGLTSTAYRRFHAPANIVTE